MSLTGSTILFLAATVVAEVQTGAQEPTDTIRFTTLAAGGRNTCGITPAAAAYCWGDNEYGQIGDGVRTGRQKPNRYPTKVKGDLEFTALAVGGRFACGLSREGAAYCWGYNFDGQIGDGTTKGEKWQPTAVKTEERFGSIVAGKSHACALRQDGAAFCWGSSDHGQVGDGRKWNRQHFSDTPVAVVGGHSYSQLTAGWDITCGLVEPNGEVYCWGGVDLVEWSDSIYRAPEPSSQGMTFSRLAGYADHVCGLAGQAAYCWGANRSGQLGDSTWVQKFEPTKVVGGIEFFQLTAGSIHTCGLTAEGQAFCWGQDFSGQLGGGDRQYANQGQPFPVTVSGGHVFEEIVAGAKHTCALTPDKLAYCWGDNTVSQIGQSFTRYQYRRFPVLIVGDTDE